MNPQARCFGIVSCLLIAQFGANQASCMSPNQTTDTELKTHLAQAQTVVSGTVTAIDAPAAQGPPGLSMHSPQWTRATITVDSIEKGSASGNTFSVFFPASNDIAWAKAPKLTKGQQGVWLVHSGESAKGAPGPAVVDPMDSRPIGELQKIRTLLKN